jgi:6-pyruvoyltetrahydropterin/6-carboxytetrahydropterin synthase
MSVEPECFLCGNETEQRTASMRICEDCREEFEIGIPMTVFKKVRIEVAHCLHGHVRCGQIHGHSMTITVGISGNVNIETGMVMDFNSLKEILQKEIVDRFDHKYLNDVLPIPTAEYFAVYLYKRLQSWGLNVALIRIQETDNNYIEYTGTLDISDLDPLEQVEYL